jgi:hypothetical protein
LLISYGYFSSVFRCFTFQCVLMLFMVSVIVPYLRPVFNMWVEYPELLLLFLFASVCSLYLVRNTLLVHPT